MGKFSRKLFGWGHEADNKFSTIFTYVGIAAAIILVLMFI